jgi:ribokinase
MSRILSIGSINLDEVFSVPHFIRPGETMACLSFERFVGGKGNNQSTALVRAGAEVHHAGKVGADGLFAVELLRDSGVDASRVIETAVPTGRALIQVDPSGQNCILLFGGANRAITNADIDAFLTGWGKGDAVLFQNEISALPYAIERAKKQGLRIYLNPSPADEVIRTLPLDAVDCFILNEIEGALLAGENLAGEVVAGGGLAGGKDSPLSVAEQGEKVLGTLRKRFPHADIVLTLGAAGACYSGVDGTKLTVPAAPVKPVDTTAAGDTFTGYFIAAMLRGETPAVAMKEATAAAGICVTRKGAVVSIPRREEVSRQL